MAQDARLAQDLLRCRTSRCARSAAASSGPTTSCSPGGRTSSSPGRRRSPRGPSAPRARCTTAGRPGGGATAGLDEAIVRLGVAGRGARGGRRHQPLHRQLPERGVGRGRSPSTATRRWPRCATPTGRPLVDALAAAGRHRERLRRRRPSALDPRAARRSTPTAASPGCACTARSSPTRGSIEALGTVDLAALELGGRVTGCSNLFYGSPDRLIAPGLARSMGEGWETARRRDDGNDWVEVRLAARGVVRVVELDTTWFLGNAPGTAALSAYDGEGDRPTLSVDPAARPHRAAARHPPPLRARRAVGTGDRRPPGRLSRRRDGPAAAVGQPDRRRPGRPAGPVGRDRMTLPDDVLRELDALLAPADAALAAGWPGEPSARQPVHTLYLPADRAGADVVTRVGAEALDAVAGQDAAVDGADRRARPGPGRRGVAPGAGQAGREPVEDLRLDLEDGYGAAPTTRRTGTRPRPASCSRRCAARRAPFVSGARVKSLEAPTRRRGVRSLDLVLASFGGTVPPGFVVTLPKVTSVDQVEAMVLLCERLESAHGFPAGSLRFEVQVETPQAVLGADGSATVARAVHAAGGRCTGLHYGTYDYSASLGVAAAHQAMDHPVADHAKAVMQVAAAQTGVRVSDGSTNVLPLGDRDARRGGLGTARATRSAVAGARASTRAGTCTPRSCRPATSRRSRSTAAAWPRRRTAARLPRPPVRRCSRRAGDCVRVGRVPAARPRLRSAGRRRGGGRGWPGVTPSCASWRDAKACGRGSMRCPRPSCADAAHRVRLDPVGRPGRRRGAVRLGRRAARRGRPGADRP